MIYSVNSHAIALSCNTATYAGGFVDKPGVHDDGTIDDLPWASVFDPAANARALSAIQAEGFRAASRIVDRFVRAVESNSGRETAVPPSDTQVTNGNAAVNGNGAVDGIKEFERLTRAWWSMTGQFLLRSLPATAKTDSESVSLDVAIRAPSVA